VLRRLCRSSCGEFRFRSGDRRGLRGEDNRRSFDCASRDGTARGCAQDDTSVGGVNLEQLFRAESKRRDNRRSFDCASRDGTARGCAQDDTSIGGVNLEQLFSLRTDI
jgi:hypothetical protein